MSGLDLIRRIKLEFPVVRLLVLSMHAEEQYALRAFSAGASGYLTKDSAANELMTAIGKVAAGGAYVSSSLAERVIHQLNGRVEVPRHTRLTDRELEIMRRLVGGRRLVDIARELHLSVKTVSTHKTRIQEKLQLPSLAALVRYGLEHQLDKGSISPEGEAG
jgi:DNA-binding NarL/FixJ family response regulator